MVNMAGSAELFPIYEMLDFSGGSAYTIIKVAEKQEIRMSVPEPEVKRSFQVS